MIRWVFHLYLYTKITVMFLSYVYLVYYLVKWKKDTDDVEISLYTVFHIMLRIMGSLFFLSETRNKILTRMIQGWFSCFTAHLFARRKIINYSVILEFDMYRLMRLITCVQMNVAALPYCKWKRLYDQLTFILWTL